MSEHIARSVYDKHALSSPGCIRILVPAAQQTLGITKYCMKVVNLDCFPVYAALSYVWGNKETVHHAYIDGRAHPVTRNLHFALSRLAAIEGLTSFQSGTPSALWIDQLCINQQDRSEKNHQVAMMTRIYRQARRVYVCLGDSATAKDACHLISRMGYKIGLDATRFEFVSDMPRADLNDVEAEQASDWEALRDMMRSEWFTRTWVVQEIGLARKATVLYGEYQFEWASLMTLFVWLSMGGRPFYDYFELSGWTTHQMWVTFDTTNRKVTRIFQPHGFLDLMSHTSHTYHVTDARDRIYALLGHPNAPSRSSHWTSSSTSLIVPAYERSVRDVYLEFARIWLQNTRDSRLLACVYHKDLPREELELAGKDKLPSWCPDWSYLPLGGSIIDSARTPRGNCASGSDKFWFKLRLDILEVRGYIFDTIAETLPSFSELPTMTESLAHEMIFHYRAAKTIFKLARLCRMVMTSPRISADQRAKIFAIFAMVTQRCKQDTLEQEESIAAGLVACLSEALSCLPSDDTSETAADYRRDLELLLASSHLQSHPEAASSGGMYVAGVTLMSDCRRLFITRRGYVGCGPDVMRKGDVCCVISGCRVPYVLRHTERGSFLLVGEAFIQGAMSGELVRRSRWTLLRPYRRLALE